MIIPQLSLASMLHYTLIMMTTTADEKLFRVGNVWVAQIRIMGDVWYSLGKFTSLESAYNAIVSAR